MKYENEDFEMYLRRRREWRPTERWENAWRRNLARAPRKHTPEESLAIKHAVSDWRDLDPRTRPLVARVGRVPRREPAIHFAAGSLASATSDVAADHSLRSTSERLRKGNQQHP